MTVPHIFGTLTGASPIDVPASYLDEDFASCVQLSTSGQMTVPHTWFGVVGLDGVFLNYTAAQATQAERGFFVGVTSDTGSADPLNYYKMGIGIDVEASTQEARQSGGLMLYRPQMLAREILAAISGWK